MKQQKRVLLIAGGGTLGTYAAKELLEQGHCVDVICLEDNTSNDPRLRYFQACATDEYLEKHFKEQYYDGIVNFLHYADPDDFKRTYPLLMRGTEHLIFLSSYRVYADRMHPITEAAPRLLDVCADGVFLEKEDYAIPKARCEDFLRRSCAGQSWTIVRPVISFSERRLDLFVYSGRTVPERALAGQPIILPAFAKDLTAGLDWAGNSGRLIARLLFKPETYGRTYTVSSGQNLTWGQVADLYTRLTGVEVLWTDEETFLRECPLHTPGKRWMYEYDRKFNRIVDNTAILAAAGLEMSQLTPLETGLRIELERAGYSCPVK